MDHARPADRRGALTDYLTALLWSGIEGVRASADIPGGLAATGPMTDYDESTRSTAGPRRCASRRSRSRR